MQPNLKSLRSSKLTAKAMLKMASTSPTTGPLTKTQEKDHQILSELLIALRRLR